MEIIYSDSKIEKDLIEECLTSLFPKLVCFNWDLMSDPPAGFDSDNPDHIFYYTDFDSDKVEFGHCFTVARMPKMDSNDREIHIIRDLAENVKTRFLTAYSDVDDPQNPYFSLIIEDNIIFLADDSNTNFADGTKQFVKKIRQLVVPIFDFTSKAEKVH